MKIKKVVNKNLRSIVSFEIADGRIFGATGRRIIELDSDLNRVSEYNGFYYTYSVKLSPDKGKLRLKDRRLGFQCVNRFSLDLPNKEE